MITDDTRLFVVNMRRVGLGPVVLAPDVEHEDAGDEQQRHHQDRDGTDLNQKLGVRMYNHDNGVGEQKTITLMPGESSV